MDAAPLPAIATPAGLPARAAALALVHGVTALGRPLEAGMDRALAGLPPSDRALATAIARAVLRWLPDLDRAIDGAMVRPVAADARVRAVLRLALAQTWQLGTPPHAVIATALPLLAAGPRRLAHGVLSALWRAPSTLGAAPTLPEPWAARWAAAYGSPAAAAIAGALGGEPPLDLTLRDPAQTDTWAATLGGMSRMPGHVRLAAPHAAIPEVAGFAEGAWWVQDLAAQLPARLLGVAAGQAVLDLCAAPGGKTLQLAAAGAAVTAVDQSARRMKLVAANLARTGLTAELVTADLMEWAPDAAPRFILLDAPCSSTGIARRHPDVLHLRRAADLPALAAAQSALLARAAGWLAPGGRLVYATCSLEPEEGEQQVAVLLAARGDLALDPIALGELPAGLMPAPEGWLRVLPGAVAGGIDGFFIARLVRR